MKNFVKSFGIIAFVAVIGFMFAACDNVKDELDGTTWKSINWDFVLTFDSPNFNLKKTSGDYETSKGTYTINGSTVTLEFEYGYAAIGELSGDRLTFISEFGGTYRKQ